MQLFKVQLQPKLPIASSTKTQMFSKIKPEDRLITRRASRRPFDAPLKPKVPKSSPPTLESLSAKRASDLVHDNASSTIYWRISVQYPSGSSARNPSLQNFFRQFSAVERSPVTAEICSIAKSQLIRPLTCFSF